MMQEQLKLIVAGHVGAGKTTFIRSISEIDAVDTDVKSSENIGKELTTVAMDYGILTLDGIPLHIYGTPGQDRFDFMWEVLCTGALGLVLLVRGDSIAEFSKSRNILDFITSRINVPFLIGVTRYDLPECWDLMAIADFFGLEPWQIIGLDARDTDSCLEVIGYMLELVVETNSYYEEGEEALEEAEEEEALDYQAGVQPDSETNYYKY